MTLIERLRDAVLDGIDEGLHFDDMRWEAADRIAELEAQNRASNLRELKLAGENEELEAKHTALEFKAKAYDAMCDVGLIQFGDDPETRCYSVWGFGAWHHDPDILKAIAAAMEPPLLGKES